MQQPFKLCAVTLTISAAFVTGTSRALTEDANPFPPAGGWGDAVGLSVGGGLADVAELPHVTIIYKRDDKPVNMTTINVPYTGQVPTSTLGSVGGNPPAPEQIKACTDSCDQKQAIGKNLCDVAAAKASASGTTAAIGIGFTVGALLTWKATIAIGAPAGFGAYVAAQTMAKDVAATVNLACIGRVAQDHVTCLTGVCKVRG